MKKVFCLLMIICLSLCGIGFAEEAPVQTDPNTDGWSSYDPAFVNSAYDCWAWISSGDEIYLTQFYMMTQYDITTHFHQSGAENLCTVGTLKMQW